MHTPAGATHGEPNERNAHPHTDVEQRVAVVHNGIIENADQLKARLRDHGIALQSDTDSEVLAHLIAISDEATLLARVRSTLAMVNGTYGIVAIDIRDPGTLVCARNGSPVIIGHSDRQMLVASDVAALSRYAREVSYLDDGEIAELKPDQVKFSNLQEAPLSKPTVTIENHLEDYDRGNYSHYMLREIHDQPQSAQQTISGRLDHRFCTAHLGGLNFEARDLLNISRVKILGCGSAYYAAMAGANMIESLARLPSSAEPAAEFRYRNPVIEHSTLYVVVSQSGETYDTLAATREIQRKGGRVTGIVNVVGSTIAREVEGGIYMHAGPEVSVASTKAYTSMLICFALLALHLGRIRDLSPQQGERITEALTELPDSIQSALACESQIKAAASAYCQFESMFFIGKADAYPIALEGAQKLKEISYIHAEAYPASELKHGPLALVCESRPTVAVVPDNDLLEKSLASIEEIKTRSGPVIVVTDSNDPRVDNIADVILRSPTTHPLLQPVLLGVILQLFAYHAALYLNRDIDQPRNLAKSVTVE